MAWSASIDTLYSESKPSMTATHALTMHTHEHLGGHRRRARIGPQAPLLWRRGRLRIVHGSSGLPRLAGTVRARTAPHLWHTAQPSIPPGAGRGSTGAAARAHGHTPVRAVDFRAWECCLLVVRGGAVRLASCTHIGFQRRRLTALLHHRLTARKTLNYEPTQHLVYQALQC